MGRLAKRDAKELSIAAFSPKSALSLSLAVAVVVEDVLVDVAGASGGGGGSSSEWFDERVDDEPPTRGGDGTTPA